MSSDGKAFVSNIVMIMRNLQLLREYVRRLLESSDEEVNDDLLVEPDEIEEREEDEEVKEFSAAGAVAGVTTPVGTGPKHPGYDKVRKKQKKKKRK